MKIFKVLSIALALSMGFGVASAPVWAEGDVKRGSKVFKKCKACHSTAKGGKNKVGPNLWDVVGRAKAGMPGFKFSGALKGLGGE